VDWIAQARNASLIDVASALNVKLGRNNSLGPCPHCGAEKRGSADVRAPIGMNATRNGWRCHQCGAVGDVVDLVAYAIIGKRLRECEKDGQHAVVTWFKGRGYVKDNGMVPEKKASAPPKSRPPKSEVQQFWLSSMSVHDIVAVTEFLESRRFDLRSVGKVGFVRATAEMGQRSWPKWWPKIWAKSYRLVTPAYDTDGNFVSLHARAVVEVEKGRGKTRWPRGYESGGLFMANRLGVQLLKGHNLDDVRGLLICEGLTDLLRASACAVESEVPLAVLSGTSGSFKHLSKVQIPQDLPVYTAMDPDTQGAKYLSEIRKALSSHQVRPLPLSET